jgi:asparagine synthase (glutamine-hydrolysing)
MCSLFGLLGDYDSQKAHDSFSRLAHRGPDACFITEKNNLFFASHRLSIEAKSETFHHDDILIALNGEIYNHLELRQKITTHTFATQTENETIFAAFRQWGEDFIHELEGMFALAIYDKNEQRLFLYRDRLGKKQLYFYKDSDHFIYASELKAIKAYHKNLQLQKDASLDYLAFQTVLAPYTFYKDVYALQAGESIVYHNNEIENFYYDDILPSKSVDVNQAEAQTILEDQLHKSVDKRIPQEVACGYFLSGGVDSSLLCALAQKKSSQAIDTFTIGYEGDEPYDESGFAKEVADYIGAKNEKVVYTYENFKKGIESIFDITDQPLNDPALLPLAHLYKHVSDTTDIKVILSGEGSDELFLGYRTHKELQSIEYMKGLENRAWIKNFFLKHESEHREWEWYRRVLEDELLFRSSAESLSLNQQKKWVKKRGNSERAFEQIKSYSERFSAKNREDSLLWYRYIDLKVHQGDYFLNKIDKTSMKYSIETRTPYLDDTLVKTALSIDSKFFIHDGTSKHLLKNIAEKYLPKSIVHRKKRGFSYPFLEWLEKAGGFKEMRMLNDKHQVFNAQVFKTVLEKGSKGEYKQHIFGMYLLLKFYERS